MPTRLAVVLANAIKVITSAVVWMLCIALGGIVAIVCGIYMLAGLPWALIASGICAICVAAFIRQGIE